MINKWETIWGQFISPDMFKWMPANVKDIVLTFMITWKVNNDIRAVINNVKKINLAKKEKEKKYSEETLYVETINNSINVDDLKRGLSKAVPTSVSSVWKTIINWTNVYFTVVKDIKNDSNRMNDLSAAIAADNWGNIHLAPESSDGMNFSSTIVNGTRIMYTAIWEINNSENQNFKEEWKNDIASNNSKEAINIEIEWDKPSIKDIIANLDKAWNTDNPLVKKLILGWREIFIAQVRESKAQSLAMSSAIMQLRTVSPDPIRWTQNFTYKWKQYVTPNLNNVA
jgi:hypothetical protein